MRKLQEWLTQQGTDKEFWNSCTKTIIGAALTWQFTKRKDDNTHSQMKGRQARTYGTITRGGMVCYMGVNKNRGAGTRTLHSSATMLFNTMQAKTFCWNETSGKERRLIVYWTMMKVLLWFLNFDIIQNLNQGNLQLIFTSSKYINCMNPNTFKKPNMEIMWKDVQRLIASFNYGEWWKNV